MGNQMISKCIESIPGICYTLAMLLALLLNQESRPIHAPASITRIPAMPAELGDMCLVVTWYDNQLGGYNCGESCADTANGTIIAPEHYGKAAACISDWTKLPGYERQLDIVGIDDPLVCIDTGPAVQVAYNEAYGQWVIHVDRLWDSQGRTVAPPYGDYALFCDWQISRVDY